MALPQPYFHDLVIDAAWDGVPENAVYLDIYLEVDAIAGSRLRLISEDIVTKADIRGSSENSFVPDVPISFISKEVSHHDNEEAASAVSKSIASVVSESPHNTFNQTSYISRIPLPTPRCGSLSPQKKPVPIAERAPWRSPVFDDKARKNNKYMLNLETRRKKSRSADRSLSPSKITNGWIAGQDDSTRQGRQMMRADVASSRALSELRNVPAGQKNKIIEWLDANGKVPENRPSLDVNHGPDPLHTLQTWRSTATVDPEALPNLPPSPSPSSQASVPWTSVKRRNPLQIRGGVLSAATWDSSNGFLYAVFPTEAGEPPLCVRLQAKVHLREDTEKGGIVLEIPGLPIQADGQGHFTLHITNDREGEFNVFEKVAHVHTDFNIQRLESPMLDVKFNTEKPFSLRLLRFKEPIETLSASDFEIDYDIRASYDLENPGDSIDDTICVRYLAVCTLRLRQCLFWAKYFRFTVFITGGPAGDAKFELAPGERQIYLNDNHCKAGSELEITLTMDAKDLAKTFTLIFDRTLGIAPSEYWLPRISSTSRTAQELLDKCDVEDGEGMFISPARCKAPSLNKGNACRQPGRDFPMLAQTKSLAAKPAPVYLPENQRARRSSAHRLPRRGEMLHGEDSPLYVEDVDTSLHDSSEAGSQKCVPPRRQDSLLPNFSREQELEEDIGGLRSDRSRKPKSEELIGSNAQEVGRASLASEVRATGQTLGIPRILQCAFVLCLLVSYLATTSRGAMAVESIRARTWEGVAALRAKSVPEFDDLTGWKHLLARLKGESVAKEGTVAEHAEDRQEAASGTAKVPGLEQDLDNDSGNSSAWEQPMEASPVEESATGEQQLSFRDRIDWALGWRGPHGGW